MSRGDDTASPTLRIEIESGPGFSLGPEDDALLRGALRAGLPFPYECSVGGCGACRFELLEGDMQTLWDAAPGLGERDRKRGKRLACQSRPRSDCRIRVRLGETPDLAPPRPRRGRARLAGREVLSVDMVRLDFEFDAAPAFLPGQYALMHLPGVAGARAYSMSNIDASDGRWQFIVRRMPTGQGSRVLCDELALGDAIDIDGPYGHAHLRPGAREVICVAGGSGLAPMLSVARGVLAEASARPVHLYLGLRDERDLGAAAELQSLDPARVRSTVVLSQPARPADWAGPTGFVHEVVEAQLASQLPEADIYLAGPPPMVDALQDLLMIRLRLPFDRIHFDRFV